MKRAKYLFISFLILINYDLKNKYKILKIIVKILFRKFTFKKVKSYKLLEDKSFKELNNWIRDNNNDCQYENILVDCMWDNANYWLRYSLFRKTLGLNKVNEFAIFSNFSKKMESRIINFFGFQTVGSLENKSSPGIKEIYDSIILMQGISNARDFLCLELPFNFPSSMLYDGMIKRQKKASIDLNDFNIYYYIAECISYLKKTEELFKKYKFDLVVLSHFQKYNYASLAWIATLKKIPVYTLYGIYGTLSFYYLKKPEDIFNFPNRPELEEKNLHSFKKGK